MIRAMFVQESQEVCGGLLLSYQSINIEAHNSCLAISIRAGTCTCMVDARRGGRVLLDEMRSDLLLGDGCRISRPVAIKEVR